ncbi:hypothetical protein [Pollutimonas thiosulfatoxidans]|uniref:Uncharacterized protein n=1 Tax=Pollutimonas thiosulfatoxidans TaxID=2028345 RepID=A0A410G9I9_9BURK|nr:hypothetical protein [Pollutimonas thiosulfatoxidans]NYT43223.1 hypothetical protein [Alcaligenaceae bacterium]QAA92979.1 hypothetical protein CKA81_03295 [Pollutimonas thiosulfatoxidans]
MTDDRPAQRRPTLWRALAGYSLWAVCLTILYAAHALGCRYAEAAGSVAMLHAPAMGGLISWALAVVWLVFIAGNVWLAMQSWKRWHGAGNQQDPTTVATSRLARVTVALDVSAVAATLVTGLPILLVPACIA